MAQYFKTPSEFQSFWIRNSGAIVRSIRDSTYPAIKEPLVKLIKLFQTCYDPLSSKERIIAGWNELSGKADDQVFATQLYPIEVMYQMEAFFQHYIDTNVLTAKKRKCLNMPSMDCLDSNTGMSSTTAISSIEPVNVGGIASLASRLLSTTSLPGPTSPQPISTTSESILIREGDDCTIIRKEGPAKGLFVTLRAIPEAVIQNKSIETGQYWLHAIWDVKMHLTPRMEEVLEELLTLMQGEMLKDNNHTIAKPQKWRNYKSS